MKVLLVTLAVGKQYLEQYNILFRKSHEEYAQKCGYDFKVITTLLDTSIIHRDVISFNKILVCNQTWSSDYDYIIFIDADILINKEAPPLNFDELGDNIGIVDEYSQPTTDRRLNIQKRMGWETSATDYYKLCGLELQTTQVFNTGVIIMQPTKHAVFLKGIFDKYANNAIGHRRGFHYEQSCIGYELQKNNMFKIIDNKFNALWALTKCDNIEQLSLQQYYKKNYFIHFAGKTDFDKIHTIIR